MIVSSVSTAPGAAPPPPDKDLLLRQTALKLESQFLSEMLKHAGFGETDSAFAGGVGEDQFASFLREGQADRMAAAGGIGLAESIYQALKARGA